MGARVSWVRCPLALRWKTNWVWWFSWGAALGARRLWGRRFAASQPSPAQRFRWRWIGRLPFSLVRGWHPRFRRGVRALLKSAWAGTSNGFGGPIALAGNGKMAYEGADHTIEIWDARSGRQLKTLVGHANALSLLKFSPDGKQLVSSDFKGHVFEWNTK